MKTVAKDIHLKLVLSILEMDKRAIKFDKPMNLAYRF